MSFLVVGGSSCIGQEVASKLSNEKSNVIVLNRKDESIRGDLSIEVYRCDITDTSVELPDFDTPLEGLVYLPGTVNLKPFQNLTEEDYRKDWEINFLGATRVIRYYLPNLRKSRLSSIVLVSSVAAQQGMAYHASIAASKGAIEAFTRSLGAELAPKIRVNCVAPSLTETSLVRHLVKDEKMKAQAANRHPLKRIGQVEDIAEVIIFLLSQKSSWITGQVMHVDGGLSKIKLF